MRTRLDPWSTRLFAVLAAAPLVYCAANGEGDQEEEGSAGTKGDDGGSTGNGAGEGGSEAISGRAGAGGDEGSPVECRPHDSSYDDGFESCDGTLRRARGELRRAVLDGVIRDAAGALLTVAGQSLQQLERTA